MCSGFGTAFAHWSCRSREGLLIVLSFYLLSVYFPFSYRHSLFFSLVVSFVCLCVLLHSHTHTHRSPIHQIITSHHIVCLCADDDDGCTRAPGFHSGNHIADTHAKDGEKRKARTERMQRVVSISTSLHTRASIACPCPSLPFEPWHRLCIS